MSPSAVTDPIGALLDIIDRRMAKFSPDRTATMGYYYLDPADGVKKVLLDSGHVIPNPVVTNGVKLGARCPCVWMQNGHDIALLAGKVARMWGDWEGDGDEWWSADGTAISEGIIHPEADSFLYPGGSDGSFIYMLSVDDTYPNQFWVSKFDERFATRLDRWEVPGWTGNPVGVSDKFWDAFSDNQPLCADREHIVVLSVAEDRPGAFYATVSLEVTVFDTSGVVIAQWVIPDEDYGRQLSSFSGLCLDADYIYFGVYDSNDFVGDGEFVMKIKLDTGVLIELFRITDVDAAIEALDPSWEGLHYTCGLVEVDGDLIINGSNGLARIRQDGTPVWWLPLTTGVSAIGRAVAHSRRGSVWACDSDANATEVQYGGTIVQTITLPEFASHAWVL